jgi:hypothetical protein
VGQRRANDLTRDQTNSHWIGTHIMGFRFRKSFGPRGLKINLSKNGISSVSIGRAPFTVNVPVGRSGGIRTTASIPGTGLSWSEQSARSGRTSPVRSAAAPVVRKRRQEPEMPMPTEAQLIASPEVGDLVQHALDVLSGMHKLPAASIPSRVQGFGNELTVYQQDSGLPDSSWQIRYLLRLFRWLNEEAQELVDLKTGQEPTYSPAAPKSDTSVKAAFTTVGIATAVMLSVFGGLAYISRTSTPSEAEQARIAAWDARNAAATAAAERQQEIAAQKQQQEFEAAQAAEKTRLERMHAAGYYEGGRGGCFTYSGSGRKQYVDRSICGSF